MRHGIISLRLVHIHRGGRRSGTRIRSIIPRITLTRTIKTSIIITFALPEVRSEILIWDKVMRLPTKEEIITFELSCYRNTKTGITQYIILLVQILRFIHRHQNTHHTTTPERDQVYIQCGTNERTDSP
jgi:hypothetical protein